MRRLLNVSLMILLVGSALAAELPQTLDLTAIRALPTQHHGRFPPVDTLARDVVSSVAGTEFFEGHDPTLMLLAWTFDSETWQKEPLIEVDVPQVRSELGLSETEERFSYDELMSNMRLRQIFAELRQKQGNQLDALESEVSKISERLFVLQSALSARAIPLIPDPEDVIAPWMPLVSNHAQVSPEHAALIEHWNAMRDAFLADDAQAFTTASTALADALDALPAAYRPDAEKMAFELHYNDLQPFRRAWMALALGAALSALAALLGAFPRVVPAVVRFLADLLALAGVALGAALQTYGLWMRGTIAGRLPAANMYESLLFLGWGAAAFAIIASIVVLFVRRGRTVPLTAAIMGALALMLADLLPIDPFIKPIAPVLLDTAWMTIHVPVIMVSYAVLAIAVLVAHVQVVVMAIAPWREKLSIAIDRVHYWYASIGAYLLLIGIITGSMWGSASWGRYWGWDPKEVWSLVAFLGYMAILHIRLDRERTPAWIYVLGVVLGVIVIVLLLQNLGSLGLLGSLAFGGGVLATIVFLTTYGRFATAVKSIMAFWLVIMTYVGVNYVLGIGLHSYAFGKGLVVQRMYMIGAADLALVLLCLVAYLILQPVLRRLLAA